MTLQAFYDSGDDKIPVEISIRLVKDVHRTETGFLQVLIYVMQNDNVNLLMKFDRPVFS